MAFGFRTFEARGGKFFLNGKLIYLRGALDQAFYPQTMYTEPSLEDLRAQMRLAKALGLNMLRCQSPDMIANELNPDHHGLQSGARGDEFSG